MRNRMAQVLYYVIINLHYLLLRTQFLHGCKKHIDTRFHFIHDLIKEEIIEVKHCKTEEQLANIFTKCLSRNKFEILHAELGVSESSGQGEDVEI